MKGHLYKKQQPEGWYVTYDIDGFTKGELPIHPEYVKYYFLDEDADYSEVDFEVVEEPPYKLYAKLIRKEKEISHMGINNDEIYKAALEYDNTTSYDTPITHFQMGAFWYREQIENKIMTPNVQELSDNVKKTKEEFIAEVNRLNYAIKLMNEPMSFVDSSLAGYIRNISRTYEDYVNSKIRFTEKYFEEKLK